MKLPNKQRARHNPTNALTSTPARGAQRSSAVFVWNHRALFVGDRSETAMHRHHAIELCLALDELGIRMATTTGPPLDPVAGAVVRANAPHQLTIHGPKVAVLYLDPTTPEAAGIHAWLGEHAIAALNTPLLHEHRAAFKQLFDPTTGVAEAEAAYSALLRSIVPHLPPPPVIDQRVSEAARYLNSNFHLPLDRAAVARQAGLSQTQLARLFRAQIGLTMSQYLLWMRLRAALNIALGGASMTEAAHRAGFADGAHFTRTCQRMFGLPPTAFAPVDALFVV